MTKVESRPPTGALGKSYSELHPQCALAGGVLFHTQPLTVRYRQVAADDVALAGLLEDES